MAKYTAFFAYPAQPVEVSSTLRRVLGHLKAAWGDNVVCGWEENDIAGRFLTDPIFAEIQQRDLVVADITFLNFNVTYEIGYSIGQKKRVIILRNTSVEGDLKLSQQIGVFDTLGYLDYPNSDILSTKFQNISDINPLKVDNDINRNSPIYYLGSENKSDWLLHLIARIRKTKYRYREFNPDEQRRLGPGEAIEEVSSSAAVIVPLLSKLHTGSQIHNIRAAFVCGLAHGMGKPCLIVQPHGGLVELDVRDLVKSFKDEAQIDQYVADLLPSVVEALQQDDLPVLIPKGILSKLDFGQTTAENETADLKRYYYVTDEFRSVLDGKIRLVIGRKGSGKTAVFMQARDRWKPMKDNVVVDLKPDAYKLRKLRDVVLQYLAEGSRDHLQTFFWEYLLLLEVC